MKKAILFLSTLIIIGCKTDNKSTEANEKVEMPKYSTLKEMFISSADFSEENNTLKFISSDEKNLHVQISKPILKGDTENIKNEIVKRDIVYVAFQTFAQTNINELTITSIPVDFDNPKEYVEKYKMTVKIERNKAKNILKKYLDSEDFSILYDNNENLWLPNSKFSILKFEKLNDVYDEISK